MFRKLALLTLLLLTSMLVSAALPAAADAPVEGRAGRAEVRFLTGMTMHHLMALVMAQDCLAKAATDDLRTLCEAIISAQSAEIQTMVGWLRGWYGVDFAMPMMDGLMTPQPGGMGMGMRGMMGNDDLMMMGMMAGLDDLTGTAYDAAWMEAMIDHHDDAVNMAQRVLRWAQHPELLDLARAIIADQSAEIALMETMIDALTQN